MLYLQASLERKFESEFELEAQQLFIGLLSKLLLLYK